MKTALIVVGVIVLILVIAFAWGVGVDRIAIAGGYVAILRATISPVLRKGAGRFPS